LTEDILRPLRLFNKHADTLLNSRFAQHGNISASVHFKQGQQVQTVVNLPDEEAIRAFVLTFRFFIQEKETSSFKRLADTYEQLPISKELKTQYSTLRHRLNDLLDSSSNLKIFNLTRRDIIWTIIYGELAHSDAEKLAMINDWRKDPVTWTHVQFEFNSSLADVLEYIMAVANLNTKVLEEITRTNA
jgi:hypothetical protein